MRSADHPAQPRELLRHARTARGWTQEDTATRIRRACPGDHAPCTMTTHKYAAFEAGLLHPGALHTRVLCQVFGMQPEDLGLGNPPGQPNGPG